MVFMLLAVLAAAANPELARLERARDAFAKMRLDPSSKESAKLYALKVKALKALDEGYAALEQSSDPAVAVSAFIGDGRAHAAMRRAIHESEIPEAVKRLGKEAETSYRDSREELAERDGARARERFGRAHEIARAYGLLEDEIRAAEKELIDPSAAK